MRTLSSALLLAATVALAAVGADTRAAAAPAPCADNAECWRGPYVKTGKKPIRSECCEQMEGSVLCTKVGDDDALVEFGPGDCRYSKNRKSLKCEKACGSGCAHKFDGSR
jgi:hypothetical protein